MNTATYDHGQTRVFALIGIFGGITCSIADYLLEYMGQASQTLGAWGVTESAWADMALWRFPASIWIACFAVPMYVLGVIAVIRQIRSTHRKLGSAFGISFLIGALGALFIHIILCVMPVVYKYLFENVSQAIAVGTVDAMTDSFIWPFFIFYTLLIIVPLVLWCVYCFQKNSLYRPRAAVIIIVVTFGCIVMSKLVPALEWIGVGAVSRMIGMWCFVAWQAEHKAA